MLKRVLKWLGGTLAVVILIAGGLFYKVQSHFKKSENLVLADPPLTIETVSQPGWLEEGQRLAKMKGCIDCHDEDMGGKVFVNDPAVGTFAGSNLTPGQGSVVSAYTDQDWVRSIRYGRGPHKKYLKFMPSHEFFFISDEDLGKLITYLKALPPVDRETTPIQVGPMMKVLYFAGKMPLLFSGENIDLSAKAPVSITPSEEPEYGKYLAAGCVGCHQPNYAGGAIPGVPPSWPKAANLTAKGNFSKWTFEEFKKFAGEGTTPDGRKLNPQFMPWPAMAAMNNTELKALYNYLHSLPAAESH